MLPPEIKDRLRLPAVCAPMMMVSGPEMVVEACRAGLMAGLPTHNAKDAAEFEAWLAWIAEARAGDPTGVLAVNLTSKRAIEEVDLLLDLCRRFGVQVIITALGDPAGIVSRAHDRGMKVFHDIVNLRHAEKAIAAGVDGLVCIGAGGGGHSGLLSHLALVPRVRAMFEGTIIMAGAVATGAGVRAAEVLGADLCYLGTRFIATQESRAPEAYKEMLVNSGLQHLIYTERLTGVSANWLRPSLERLGLPADPPPRREELPTGAKPWYELWSAGQGVDLITDVPTVRELTQRLLSEYLQACAIPAFGAVDVRAPAHRFA